MMNLEMELLEGLKKDCNIKSNRFNKSIKLLIKQYIKSEITKESLMSILNDFSKAN